MALQDIINNFNKKKEPNSFLPTNEQGLDVQADTTPGIPEIKNGQTAQENKEAASSSAMPTVKYPNKPESMSDNDYEHLMSIGYSPEAISNYTKPYDPSINGNYLQRIFESSVPKPSAPDEKKVRNAKLVSTIADSLGLLSQMWSYGKGANVQKRDSSNTALSKTEEREKDLRNIYLQQQNKYNDGMYNARLNDFLKGLEDYNNGRKGIQGAITSKRKSDLESAKFAFDMTYREAILNGKDADRALKEAQIAEQSELNRLKFEEQKRHNKTSEGISSMNAQSNRMRANVSVNKSAGGTSKSIPFFFKDGTNVNIPDNIWKANYPVLIDILVGNGVPTPMSWFDKSPTASQAEYFIKQNKDRLPEEARSWLKEISKMNPSEYGDSETNSDEFEDY